MTEEWIIVTTFRDSGDQAYWGRNRHSGAWGNELTPYRGNAHRYESEAAALHVAYGLKERDSINDFHVEQIIKPRLGQRDCP